jgi:hypothetical protein
VGLVALGGVAWPVSLVCEVIVMWASGSLRRRWRFLLKALVPPLSFLVAVGRLLLELWRYHAGH